MIKRYRDVIRQKQKVNEIIGALGLLPVAAMAAGGLAVAAKKGYDKYKSYPKTSSKFSRVKKAAKETFTKS